MILDNSIGIMNIEDKIKSYTDAIEEQNNIIEKAVFYRELVNDALIRYIRGISYPFFEDTFKNALNYINKKTEDDTDYKHLNRIIQEEILGIKYSKKKYLKEIVMLGFGPVAYEMIFDYKGYTFQFTVPINSRISLKDLSYTDYGRMMLHWKDGGCSWGWIDGSYTFDGLKEAMQKFLEEHEI